jgi:hypothetical protein
MSTLVKKKITHSFSSDRGQGLATQLINKVIISSTKVVFTDAKSKIIIPRFLQRRQCFPDVLRQYSQSGNPGCLARFFHGYEQSGVVEKSETGMDKSISVFALNPDAVLTSWCLLIKS